MATTATTPPEFQITDTVGPYTFTIRPRISGTDYRIAYGTSTGRVGALPENTNFDESVSREAFLDALAMCRAGAAERLSQVFTLDAPADSVMDVLQSIADSLNASATDSFAAQLLAKGAED